MRKILVLKNELKELAENIRKAKSDCKAFQREHGGSDGDWAGKPGESPWISHYSIISKLKHEFRHKHIAYCLLRGRTLDEIEHPAEVNKPDQTLIQEILHAYTENVCVSA
jgi:hypothetical protein